MKKIYTIGLAVCLFTAAQAQNFEDAVRFSRLPNYGTARVTAMGGAFNALGGDISAILNNPAGIGVFRKSEFSFTPQLNFTQTKAGNETGKKTSFQVGDMGAVMTLYMPDGNWKGINFSVNYTNLNNFNRKTRQVVGNSYSSFTDVMALQAGNTPSDELDGFLTGLAYDAFLINRDEEKGEYYSVLALSDVHENVAQVKETEEKGFQGEYTLAFGSNYKDKLYIGMSIGVQSVYYKMLSTFTEAPDMDSPSKLDYYTYSEYKKMNGAGINLKFGAIYRPIPALRLGASIHTPTWYNINYTMYTGIYSEFITDFDERTGREKGWYEAPSYEMSVDYNMRSPWRAVVGVATVLGQKAILSADYEFVKYTNAKFTHSSDGYDYGYENSDILAYLRPTHNFRAGAEYRFNPVFSLRAGYNFKESPYYENNKDHNRLHAFSGGFGLNFGTFYCDAAFVHRHSQDETVFYSYGDEVVADPVKNKYKSNEARITFGIRF